MEKHECPTCGRDDFAREVDMKAHHTIAHGESLVKEDNPRECPMCGEIFASVAGMKAHHKLIHAESIAESRNVTQSIRQTVIERDGNRCQGCGIDVTSRNEDGADFQLHHIIPFSAGGPDHPDNLVTLCNECHNHAHQRMKDLVEDRPELLHELRAIICAKHRS